MTRLLARLGRGRRRGRSAPRRQHRSVWLDLVRICTASLALSAAALQVAPIQFATRSQPASGTVARVAAAPIRQTPEAAPAALGAVPKVNTPAIAGPARQYPRILIPAIGVDAYLESIGLDALHRIATPRRPQDAAWYSPGPAPGQPGDAIIDGHLDTPAGTAVFASLDRLQTGNLVIVDWGGHTITFRVTALRSYDYSQHPPGLFSTSGPPQLTLITCAGPWDQSLATYRRRLLVESSLA